jgi:hypothetical protein
VKIAFYCRNIFYICDVIAQTGGPTFEHLSPCLSISLAFSVMYSGSISCVETGSVGHPAMAFCVCSINRCKKHNAKVSKSNVLIY